MQDMNWQCKATETTLGKNVNLDIWRRLGLGGGKSAEMQVFHLTGPVHLPVRDGNICKRRAHV